LASSRVAESFSQLAQQSRDARATGVTGFTPAKSLYEKYVTVGEMEQTLSTPVADTKGERAGVDSMACMRPVTLELQQLRRASSRRRITRSNLT
jgi:hypothetical protein